MGSSMPPFEQAESPSTLPRAPRTPNTMPSRYGGALQMNGSSRIRPCTRKNPEISLQNSTPLGRRWASAKLRAGCSVTRWAMRDQRGRFGKSTLPRGGGSRPWGRPLPALAEDFISLHSRGGAEPQQDHGHWRSRFGMAHRYDLYAAASVEQSRGRSCAESAGARILQYTRTPGALGGSQQVPASSPANSQPVSTSHSTAGMHIMAAVQACGQQASDAGRTTGVGETCGKRNSSSRQATPGC